MPAGAAAPEAYAHFRQAAADALAARADDLRRAHGPGFRPPALPPLPHAPASAGAQAPVLHGAVHFTRDWQAAFQSLDQLPARRTSRPRLRGRDRLGEVRTRLEPVLPPRSRRGATG
ncbi:hypothetical protein WJ438_38490 [Streptomyces sp. GD-15H]|uniref:hypothetical protein n=1 Tax=Streptomyces sp. GD-15H TaxID=3129112 RepID=UPI003251A76B